MFGQDPCAKQPQAYQWLRQKMSINPEKKKVTLSVRDTRFSAYFEGSLTSFVKRIETTIASLKMRTDSTDKKVRDKAAEFLRKIFFTLAILDIYILLGGFSSLLHFHGIFERYSRNC